MARAKKETALTPEERLQAALVPDWEWPYKLPENWCWTTVGAINQYVGISADPTKAKNETFELYSVPSSADNYPEIVLGADIGSTKQAVKKGDVLLCKINPRINRVWKVSKYTDHSLLASSEWIVVRNSRLISNYLMWCFRSPYFRGYMLSNVSGVGGSLMRAQPKFVQGYPVPVPPLAEQQRIVDRIESLFAKLDEAKEKAQAVLDSFETRKAAILHKAFTGELTAKWREEHGVGMDSWRTISFKDVCKKITDGTHHSPINTENGEYMYITAKNIKEHGIDLTNITFVSKDVHEEIYSRCDVQYGDVLYIKDGATTGIATVNTIDKPFSLLSSVAVLRPDKKQILAEYMAYNLNSSKTKTMMISSMSGNAITRLTLSKIKAASITICSLDEQEEIVRLIDDLLGKEQQAKETAEIVLNQIDLMKKSILARAFRGELGTNDPSEESAVELLKKIIRRG